MHLWFSREVGRQKLPESYIATRVIRVGVIQNPAQFDPNLFPVRHANRAAAPFKNCEIRKIQQDK